MGTATKSTVATRVQFSSEMKMHLNCTQNGISLFTEKSNLLPGDITYISNIIFYSHPIIFSDTNLEHGFKCPNVCPDVHCFLEDSNLMPAGLIPFPFSCHRNHRCWPRWRSLRLLIRSNQGSNLRWLLLLLLLLIWWGRGCLWRTNGSEWIDAFTVYMFPYDIERNCLAHWLHAES